MTPDQAVRSRGARRPLPGVSFETPAAGRAALLPRLDVTGFVGYAEGGPLDIPVLVQDPARFSELFGADVVLGVARARETDPAERTDRRVRTLLGPTVRAFFDNGGHSCWVVRVGVDATTSRFVVPGLVTRPSGAMPLASGMHPVVLEGRAPGSFLDGHAAMARIRRRGIPTLDGSLALAGGADGSVVVPASVSARRGELLELVLESGVVVWVPIGTRSADATGRATLSWSAEEETWLEPVHDLAVAGPLGGRVAGPMRDDAIVVESLTVDGDGRATFLVRADVDLAPAVGDVVTVDDPGSEPALVMTVDTDPVGDPALGPSRCRVRAWPAWRLQAAGVGRARPIALARAAVLDLDLATRSGDAVSASVEGLGFADSHPAWFGRLPSDRQLFRRTYREVATGSPAGEPGPLDLLVDSPRFALAAPDALPSVCLPLGLGLGYGASGIRPAVTGPAPALVRNGLAGRDPAAFVDPDLAGLGARTLMEAARRRFLVEGEDLRGVHALLPVEDVAVLAAPDALHGSWQEEESEASPVVLGPKLSYDAAADRLAWDDPFPVADPVWAADQIVLERCARPDFESGVETTTLPGSARGQAADRGRCGRSFFRVRALRRGMTSPWSGTVQVPRVRGPFDDYDVIGLEPPILALSDLLLSWTPVSGPFEVQLSPHPILLREVASTSTTDAHLLASRPAAGTAYARVRRVLDGVAGPWSQTVTVRGRRGTRWLVTEPNSAGGEGAVSDTALEVHHALGAVAEARQDLTVLLSFPRWYAADHVERHLGRLAELLDDELDRLQAHHPWTLVAGAPETSGAEPAPSAVPADGAVAGQMARGSLRRGPWVAVAGPPLDGTLGVASGVARVDPVRLRGAQVNSLVATRRGVMLTGVDTLARDRQIRPVTIRRLLILVRRLALREGRELVFEPNGPDLWRLLQTRFESALGLVYRLGGLVGGSPTEAYRVLCDEGLNPPRVMDAGKVVVELQLAPSHPLEFVVVRLVQGADGGFQLAEVTR